MGVGTQGGAEAMVHSFRELIHEHSSRNDLVCLKIDFSNAFNLVDRSSFLREVVEHFPQLAHWASWVYEKPSHLFFGSRVISSESGVQQGDPLGPFLFSIVLHKLVKTISETFPHILFNQWYLDDGVIVGKVEEVVGVLKVIEELGPSLGLHVNLAKCEIWWSGNAQAFDDFSLDLRRCHDNGIIILGIPVGDPEYCRSFIRKKIESISSILPLVLNMDDAQIELTLLKGCLGFGKLNHLMRACVLEDILPVLSEMDEVLRHTLSSSLCLESSMGNDAWLQATLPTDLGGLGLFSCVSLVSAASAASIVSSTPLVCRILRKNPAFFRLSYCDATMESLCQISHSSHTFDSVARLQNPQKSLSRVIHGVQFQDILSRASIREQARIRAVSCDQANDWINALPIDALGLRVETRTFRIMVRRLLGIPLFQHTRCSSDSLSTLLLQPYGCLW